MIKNKTKVGYLKLKYRILISLPVSVFFVLFGSGISIFNAFWIVGFYYSAMGSFLITLIIINTVHHTTIYLDSRLNWISHFFLRMLWQILLCFLAPSVLTYITAALYFRVFGINIYYETKYLTFDLPWVLVLIASFNIYYIIYYIFKYLGLAFEIHEGRIKISYEQKASLFKDDQAFSINELAIAKETSLPPLITYQNHNTMESVDVDNKVAFFYYARNYYWVRTFDGHSLAIKQNLSEIENLYCGSHFFRINRKIIVNKRITVGYYKTKNGNYMVRLSGSLSENYPLLDKSQFCLSNRKVSKFKKWLQKT